VLVVSTDAILSQRTYIGAMDVFETTADLIHKVLEMRIRERLARADDLMKIGFHQFLYKVTKRMYKVSQNPWMRSRSAYISLKSCKLTISISSIEVIYSKKSGKRRQTISVIVAYGSLRFHDR
jgi:hypothetical protein